MEVDGPEETSLMMKYPLLRVEMLISEWEKDYPEPVVVVVVIILQSDHAKYLLSSQVDLKPSQTLDQVYH